MLKITQLCRDYLFFPARGAAKNKENGEMVLNASLYLVFLLLSLLFYWLKPWNFPDHYAPFPSQSPNFYFWLKVMLWQPPLEIVWILCLFGLMLWLEKGNLLFKLITSVFWTAMPFILIIFYVKKNGISKVWFDLGEILCFALFIFPLLKIKKAEAWPIAGFMLGLNVIGIVLLLPMVLSIFLDSNTIFNGSQVVGGLWMLWAGMMGLRELRGIRLSRAFLAVLFSLLFQIAFAFALYFMGLVPKEILKALLYA